MSATMLQGGCRCGALAVAATLTQPLASYVPRACDCSFCRARDVAWLSDAHGAVRLQSRDAAAVAHYRQGSGQADFLACAHCGDVVMVVAAIDGGLYAAVNARMLAPAAFAPAQPASPQLLSAQDKRERWQRLWFSDVRIETPDGGGQGRAA